MTNFINAEEARRRTEASVEEIVDKQFRIVYKRIEEAINKGEYKTHFYQVINEHCINKLLDSGYAVDVIHDRNETSYCISWEEEND